MTSGGAGTGRLVTKKKQNFKELVMFGGLIGFGTPEGEYGLSRYTMLEAHFMIS